MDKQQEEKIREMYSKRRPIKHIRQATGITEKKIRKWLEEQGLWTGHKSLPYYFDEFFFDVIDTEEKAYWLGFIYADGYLTQSTNEIGIELKSTDYEHLEKFKAHLQSEAEVKIYHKNSTYGPQDSCRFTFSSAHMRAILLSYYKSVNKTFEGEFPKISNPNLIRHVIRGFFDGDGSLAGVPKDTEHVFRPQISFIGTKETLEYIEQLSGFSWSWSQRMKDKQKNNYQICCGRANDCIDFLNYMYKDSHVYLDRKYQRYLQMLENRTRLSTKVRV